MRRSSLLPHILLLLVVLVFVLHAAFTSLAVVDDAYIAFRYSSNLAHGRGLTFNPGQRVEGYTCFLWVVLGAMFERVGAAPAVALPVLGVGLGAATIVLVVRSLRRLRESEGFSVGAWAGIPSAVFLAATPSLAYYSGSGLETALFCCMTAGLAASLFEMRPARLVLFAMLAFLTRPEGAAIGAIALLLGLLRAEPRTRHTWVRCIAVFGLAGIAYAGFKWSYFHALLPNTFAAKPADHHAALAYVGWGLLDSAPVLLLSAIFAYRERERAPHATWAFVLSGFAVVVVLAEGSDWMAGYRFLLPALTIASFGIDALMFATLRGSTRVRVAIGGLSVFAAGFFLYWSSKDTKSMHDLSETVRHYDKYRDRMVESMWEGGVRSIGTLDIGRITHVEPELRVLDLGGLTDQEIAAGRGGYQSKEPPPELLERKRPNAFLFAAKEMPTMDGSGRPTVSAFHYRVERYVSELPWFRQRYYLREALPVRADYVLLWYAPIPQ